MSSSVQRRISTQNEEMLHYLLTPSILRIQHDKKHDDYFIYNLKSKRFLNPQKRFYLKV